MRSRTESRTSDDANEFLTSAAEKLQQALQNRAVVIFAERQDEYVAVAKVGVADSLLGRLRLPHTFAEMLDRPFDPRRRTLSEDAAAALARIEAVLVVPIAHARVHRRRTEALRRRVRRRGHRLLPLRLGAARGRPRPHSHVGRGGGLRAGARDSADAAAARDAARREDRRQRRVAAGAHDGRRLLRSPSAERERARDLHRRRRRQRACPRRC